MSGADLSIRVILGGPPHSGKSTLAVRITYALQNLGIDSDFKDLDLWSQTIALITGTMTQEEKEKHKRKDVSIGEVKEAVSEFQQISENHAIVIGDGPGGISNESELIFASATHGIIVCKDDETDKIEEWEKFFNRLGVPIVVIVISKLSGTEKITLSDPINMEVIGLNKTTEVTLITIQLAYALKKIFGI